MMLRAHSHSGAPERAIKLGGPRQLRCLFMEWLWALWMQYDMAFSGCSVENRTPFLGVQRASEGQKVGNKNKTKGGGRSQKVRKGCAGQMVEGL